MTTYSIKMPDLRRNKALAGQTVSTRGMNVTYDENGYAVKARNYGHEALAGTSKSIRAASKEAVLAAGSRSGYDGPNEDQAHFTDREFAWAVELRRKVAAGEMSAAEANDEIEGVRRTYGYTFGASGNQYAAIVLPDEQPEEVIMAQLNGGKAQTSVQAQSVQNAAPPPQNAAPQDTTPPQDDAGSETEQIRRSYQTQLHEQQQRRTIQDELEELRLKSMGRAVGKGNVSDALLALMDEEEDD